MIKTSVGEGLRSSMSASPLTINVDALQQQFENTKVAERDRHDFVESLLKHIETLHNGHQESTRALRAQEMLANAYQDRFEAAEKQLNNLQRSIDCDMFVLVVIDGDDTLFKDDYIKDGIQGGQRAAQDLGQALFDNFKDKHYFKHDYKIVTKIYLNFVGLSKTYCDAGITSGFASYQQFVQGFNKMHELMEIIDAGNGKEGADSKVKAEFNLFRRNLQCKQIVFSGSGDNSYGNFLRPCAPISNKSDTITLIEALPFAQELQMLSSKFEVVRFDDIFRSTKITVKQTQRQDDTVRRLMPPTPETPSTPSVSYASKVLSSSPVNKVGKVTVEEDRAITANKASGVVQMKKNGHRIDKPIKNLDKDLVSNLKQRRLCNRYYLLGNCSFTVCIHDHKAKLSKLELEHLRHVARLTPCMHGPQCDDPTCINGHQCQYGRSCMYRKNDNCRFNDVMHTDDTSNT